MLQIQILAQTKPHIVREFRITRDYRIIWSSTNQSSVSMENALPAMFWIESDGIRLKQILLNLAMNSLNQTDEGRVEVEINITSRKQSTDIESSKLTTSRKRSLFSRFFNRCSGAKKTGDGSETTDKDVEVQCVVRDTGCGLSDAEKAKLFNMFEQANTRKSSKGSGLGLVLVKEFVRLLGGQVQVVSPWQQGGTGVCFWFSFAAKSLAIDADIALQLTAMSSRRNSHRGSDNCAPRFQRSLSEISQSSVSSSFRDFSPIFSKPNMVPSPSTSPTLVCLPPPEFQHPLTPGPLGTPLYRTPLISKSQIPARTVTSETITSSEFSDDEDLEGMKVLIVDDIEINRSILRRKLSSGPFKHLNWTIEEVNI
jgi:hypothetical protein